VTQIFRVAILALLCGGCAVRQPIPQTYRLVAGPLLVPPGVAGADVGVRTFTAQVAAGMGKCGAGSDAVGIRAHGTKQSTKLEVTVRRDALAKQKPGWLSEWAAGLEADGCVASGEGRKLADQVADSVAMDPGTAFRLRYPTAVEIGPQIRIQVVSPILAGGAKAESFYLSAGQTTATASGLQVEVKAPENVLGYETAWYSVTQKQGGAGSRIAPLSAERHVKGGTERREQPERDYFPFAGEAGFYRLFYKEQQTAFTALVVAGVSRAALEERAQALAAKASCDAVPEGYCVAIPKSVAVNLFLPVAVNGKEVMVRWGARVGDAIREGGERQADAVLRTLTVTKMYRGSAAPVEFDRGGKGILDLALVGGERIGW
jgi:hypothetical protein